MTSKCVKNKKSGTRGAAECVTDKLELGPPVEECNLLSLVDYVNDYLSEMYSTDCAQTPTVHVISQMKS